MTRKTILFCITLFILTALSSTYYLMELPLRDTARTMYNLWPLFSLRIVFPLFWGVFLFLLLYFQKFGETSGRIARMIIESFFLIANILSELINFKKFFDFPSYNLILIGLLSVGILFEITQIITSKKEDNSPQ